MISPEWQRNVTGRKTESDPGRGARISNGTRPQDPGGGEKQLTTIRDETVVWPVLPPTLQSGEVRVSTGGGGGGGIYPP